MFVAYEGPSTERREGPARPTALLGHGFRGAAQWCELRLANPWIWLSAVLAVVTLQSALVVTHRHWLDEWQALQIAVQSPDLAALFENLRYEGHPPLWYLLLRGAARFVPNSGVLLVLQLTIASALQFLILARLPLSRLERLLFSMNFYVVMDYVTISRSMGLGVALFIAALVFRRHRASWLALALLPLTDFLFGILSVVGLAIYRRERLIWLPGLLLWVACGIAAAWSVRPAPDIAPASLTSTWLEHAGAAMTRFGTVFFPFQYENAHFRWDTDLPLVIGVPLGFMFFLMGWEVQQDRFSRILFAGFCAIVALFSVYVYGLAPRHVSLCGLLLVMLVALARENGVGEPSAPFQGWLCVGAILGAVAAANNVTTEFDSADKAAQYIEAHQLTNKHWAVYPDFYSQSVSAMTGVEFERIEMNCTQSFLRWNHRSKIKTYVQLEQALDRISARQGSYYLLMEFELERKRLARPAAYELLTHVPAGYDGKDYYLYRVRGDLPERPSTVPQCAPRRIPMPPVGRY